MEYIGLSRADLDLILRERIDFEKPVRPEFMREAIAKAIEENNKKLLEDIRRIVG